MNDIKRYAATIFWNDEDEGFIALALDLPGCSAFGETQAAALTELQDAIAAWIAAAEHAGHAIPQPSKLPAFAAGRGLTVYRRGRYITRARAMAGHPFQIEGPVRCSR